MSVEPKTRMLNSAELRQQLLEFEEELPTRIHTRASLAVDPAPEVTRIECHSEEIGVRRRRSTASGVTTDRPSEHTAVALPQAMPEAGRPWGRVRTLRGGRTALVAFSCAGVVACVSVLFLWRPEGRRSGAGLRDVPQAVRAASLPIGKTEGPENHEAGLHERPASDSGLEVVAEGIAEKSADSIASTTANDTSSVAHVHGASGAAVGSSSRRVGDAVACLLRQDRLAARDLYRELANSAPIGSPYAVIARLIERDLALCSDRSGSVCVR